VDAGFTTAAQPDAAFASCYKKVRDLSWTALAI